MNIAAWAVFFISDTDRERAEELAKETRQEARKQGLTPIFQTTALENEIIGLIGEAKFEEYLIELGIDYVKDRPVGRSDKFDFLINDRIYSVKTNLNDWYPRRSPSTYGFLINKRQYDYHGDAAYYISMMVWRKKAWFCGFISRAEVLAYPIANHGYGLSYKILYSDLHPPEDLHNTL